MRFGLIIIFICCAVLRGQAQSIENVDFVTFDDYIRVTFNITNSPDNKLYDLKVLFVKPDGTSIIPNNLRGDVKRVTPGVGKQILWYYKTDVEDYAGELKVVVSILNMLDANAPVAAENPSSEITNEAPNGLPYKIEVSKPFPKGGPGNAFLSALLPGWGDHYVNRKEKVTPFFITAAFLGTAYMSYKSMNDANEYFDQYLKTTSQSVMDEMYPKAIESRNAHQLFLEVAGAIWLYDVIHVAIKGSRNIKKNTSVGGIQLIPKYNKYRKSNPFEISFVKQF